MTKPQKIEGGWEKRWDNLEVLYESPEVDGLIIKEPLLFDEETEAIILDFISTEIEKAKAEAKQEVYLSMITSDLPTDYTGTATTPQEYSDNMKKFIKDEIEKHKIAIKRLKRL